METPKEEASQVSEIRLNLDEFDLENYELSPITQGLGFHHEEKKKSFSQSTPRRVKASHIRVPTQTPLVKSFEVNNAELLASTGLEPFYGYQVSASTDKVKKPKAKKMKLKSAGEIDQFCAFLLDGMVLIGSYVGVISTFIFIAGLPFEWNALKPFWFDFWSYFISVLGMIFLFYFTLLDSAGTFGKSLMSLRLINVSDSRPSSLKQNFIRAFVSLMGLALLGFPLLVDFQGKLSHTKLVKD